LSLKYEIIDRNFNFNDVEKSAQCKKLTRKLGGNNNSGVWGVESPASGG